MSDKSLASLITVLLGTACILIMLRIIIEIH